MRRDVVLALFLASTSGLFAAVGAYNWMPSGPTKTLVLKSDEPQIPLTTVVVAKHDMAFGVALGAEQLTEAKWPSQNIPEGSYHTIKELFGEQRNRVVLEAIRGNEPILRGKISGPGQRATLSNMLGSGKKAVTIKVNDVLGVGGFVMPGDFVDILLIVDEKEAEDRKKPKKPAYTDLLIERVRVLAIDQLSDLKMEAPKLGQTVTVEVSLVEAQKIALASTIGTLSLVLRSTANLDVSQDAHRMKVSDLGDSGDNAPQATFQPTNAVAEEPAKVPPSPGKDEGEPPTVKINIVRSVDSSEYTVARSKPKD
ncbi:MAG: Flp pilus assembly protein CpaB [Hyphomicrobiaceae bacterium]|nr:Flp pilus assembly protein CpaB [Hyphomicrobiaceae bacterium]